MNRKIILLIFILAVVFLILRIVPVLGSDKEKVRKVILDAKAAVEKENALKCISFVSMDYEDRHGNNRGSLFAIAQSVFKSYDDTLIIIEELRVNLTDSAHARARVIASGQSRRMGEEKWRYFLDSERVEFDVDLRKEDSGWKVVKLDFIEPREFMQFLMGI